MKKILLFSCMLFFSSTLFANAFQHTNSKGKQYYLFSKEIQFKNSQKKRTIYFFSKKPTSEKGHAVSVVPQKYMVSETKNGLPVLKKKKKE